MTINATAIIVAAGAGLRVGGDTPKVYLPLCGRAILLRTLDRVFAAKRVFDAIVVVAAEEYARCQKLLGDDPMLSSRRWVLQTGGATRQESVRRGLARVGNGVELVAIHDGARPFVSSELFDRCIEVAEDKGAVVPGLPPGDTIKVVGPDASIQSTLPRGTLRLIQTPQVFRRELIQHAHELAMREGFEATDDAMLVERLGKSVYVIEGEKLNFKITQPEDVWLGETLIRDGKIS